MHVINRSFAGASGRLSFPATGGKGAEEIGEGSDDELVGVFPVKRKIAEEELVEVVPVGPYVEALRHHHLLHRPTEVGVWVAGVGGYGESWAEEGGGLLHDGVGATGRGEEEAVGGEDAGEIQAVG